jgi:hypothetical protein
MGRFEKILLLVLVCLRTFAANATGKLNVFGHDSHTLGVNGTQVRVLKKSYEVGFCSFLEGKHGAVGIQTSEYVSDPRLHWSSQD